MNVVKAVINLKDGVIELEGPQEFVEKYLQLYAPDAGKLRAAIPQEDEAKTKEGEAVKQTRSRVAKPKGALSCAGRVSVLIEEGYFKDQKTSAEIMNWLKDQKGIPYAQKHVAAALITLIKSGKLRRVKEGGVYKYCNP